MSENLFQKTLTSEEGNFLESYNIYRLLLVAFCGGMIPLIVLSLQNAKWLNMDKKIIWFMRIVGIAYLISRAYVSIEFPLVIDGGSNPLFKECTRYYRVIIMVVAVIFVLIMKNKYHYKMMTNTNVRPILKTAAIWSVIGFVMELILGYAGVFISNGL